MVMLDLEVGDHHLAPALACLEAQVRVVSVEPGAQRLVEAELLDRPAGEDEQEAVDHVDLA